MRAVDDMHEWEGDIHFQSQKAICFTGDYWDKPEHTEGVWLSKRFCEIEIEPGTNGSRATVRVPDWLAKKAGLENYD